MISVSFGRGKSGEPEDPQQFESLAAFAGAIKEHALLKTFKPDITETMYSRKKNAGPWVMRAIDEATALDPKSGKWHRRIGAVSACDWLMFDADKMPFGSLARVRKALKAEGFGFIIYKSTGHELECKGGLEAFRVVIRLDVPVNAAVAEAVSCHFRENFLTNLTNGGEWDPACDQPTRIIYLPFIGQDIYLLDGEPLYAADYFNEHELTIVKAGRDGMARGEADVGVFGDFVDFCLANVDSCYLVTKPDGRVALQMPGQQPDLYSTTNAGDGWNFYLPSGDYDMLAFVSLHTNSEPAHSFKINHAVNVLAREYGAELAGLYSKASKLAQQQERDRKRAQPLKKVPVKQRHPEDNFEVDIAMANGWIDDPDMLPADLEDDREDLCEQAVFVGVELCRLCAGGGVPFEDLYENGQPSPGGLFNYGFNLDAIDKFFRSACWSPDKGRAFLMTEFGLASYARADLELMLAHFEPFVDIQNAALRIAIDDREEEVIAAETAAQQTAARILAWTEEEPEKPAEDKRKKPKRVPFLDMLKERLNELVFDVLRDVKNQTTMLRHTVDMFATEGTMTIDRAGVATFEHVYKPFVAGPIDPVMIAEYKKHFPMLDTMIEFLAACRFASDRKNAFLWLQAPSDWGKGFFTSALSDLGVVVAVEDTQLSDLLAGKPAGFTSNDFVEAWAILVNECRKITPNMKRLEKDIVINPKNQMVASVPVYAKLFTSADPIATLTGEHGVDDQFANRFSLWEAEGNIKHLDRFASKKSRYHETLRNYVAEELNLLVQEYIAAGYHDAASRADMFLDSFHTQYGIARNYGRMSDNFDALRDEFIEWCCNPGVIEKHGFTDRMYKYKGGLFMTNIADSFSKWSRATKSASDKQFLDDNRDKIVVVKPTAIHGKTRKGIWLIERTEKPEWMQ